MKRPIVISLLAAGVLVLVAAVVVSRRGPREPSAPAHAPPASATVAELPTLGRPNIVLISLDTVRPDHLGCYGYPRPTTPNLDALALDAGGVRFAQARAQAPWTLPSHMSLFTSMLPSHNRVETINQVLPDAFATLPQVLQAHGYATAAIVNNGQMRAHWGFDRGFELWKELEVDTPAGNCENVTAQALSWLDTATGAARDKPWFLFLHYYDAHDPYDPPPAYREPFDVGISGEQARELAWRGRSHEAQLAPDELTQLRNAYDGELAWLDHELGKLFAGLPPDTLVVLFSDHGEAFEEHGWTLHGATLHEEEVRALLVMRHPRLAAPPAGARVVDAPVMLIDVAPTVLGLCGIEPPPHFTGADLRPLLSGQRADGPRAILSETKAVLEGRALKSITLPPWKLPHDLIDGSSRLYKLPDETADLSAAEPVVAAALGAVMATWAAEDDHWLFHADGPGEMDVTLSSDDGQFLVFIPAGVDPRRDAVELSGDAKTLHWIAHPRGGRQSLYVQMSPAAAALRLDVKANGRRDPSRVFLGAGRSHPRELPTILSTPDLLTRPSSAPPVAAPLAPAGEQALLVLRHPGPTSAPPARAGTLDEATVRQLRSLGYLR